MKARPEKIDRDAFYELLFKRANSQGKLVVNQTAMAEEFGYARWTIVRLFEELRLQGKVIKLSEHRHRRLTYRIVDPEVWKWKNQ